MSHLDTANTIAQMEQRLNHMLVETPDRGNESVWLPILRAFKTLLPPFENTDIIIRLELLIRNHRDNATYFGAAGVPSEALRELQQADDLERVVAALRIIRKLIATRVVDEI